MLTTGRRAEGVSEGAPDCGRVEFNSTIDVRNVIVFFLGRDPGTLKSDIVSTKNIHNYLFGFETLRLKIRRLKLWKPTVLLLIILVTTIHSST